MAHTIPRFCHGRTQTASMRFVCSNAFHIWVCSVGTYLFVYHANRKSIHFDGDQTQNDLNIEHLSLIIAKYVVLKSVRTCLAFSLGWQFGVQSSVGDYTYTAIERTHIQYAGLLQMEREKGGGRAIGNKQLNSGIYTNMSHLAVQRYNNEFWIYSQIMIMSNIKCR